MYVSSNVYIPMYRSVCMYVAHLGNHGEANAILDGIARLHALQLENHFRLAIGAHLLELEHGSAADELPCAHPAYYRHAARQRQKSFVVFANICSFGRISTFHDMDYECCCFSPHAAVALSL